jgi:indolepyruvate ferredoxin oxidoreductase
MTTRKMSTAASSPRAAHPGTRLDDGGAEGTGQDVGGSAIVYIQTCAAEKRRRRKKGQFPDPDRRVWINPRSARAAAIAGCSRTASPIVPKDTELGRKRAIDQSSCNKDYSCVNGFCPSFVSFKGGKLKKPKAAAMDLPDMPAPALPAIQGTHNTVITGVGGTGVVTIGAVLAQAAHMDGKGAGMMEMAGLAQKGGAVHIHLRLANQPEISAPFASPWARRTASSAAIWW